MAGGWLSPRLRQNPRWRRRLTRFAGSALLLLALQLLYPQKACCCVAEQTGPTWFNLATNWKIWVLFVLCLIVATVAWLLGYD